MKKGWILRLVLSGSLILSAISLLVGCSPASKAPLSARLVGVNPPQAGFQRADGQLSLSFPQDYGAHPDYQTEWWYYTGNLDSQDGRHFGYQLTFFRRALVPREQSITRSSDWASDQVYMAHFALSDIGQGDHPYFERLSRGAAGLAGAQAAPFHVWLEDWEVLQNGDNSYQLHASQQGVEVDLKLVDEKGLVLHGENSYSQKGPNPGNASYYISQTHLASSGVVQVGGKAYPVSGLSWMDHEFSTSALSAGQVGWDWFSLQLEDGSELMVFQIRRSDGSIDPYSSGTLIQADGSTVHLPSEAFSIEVLDTWKSPHSKANYPAGWTLSVPQYGIKLKLEPLMADQELNVSFTYWEGAVSATGEVQGKPVMGNGYVELTGYAHSMEGEF
jgi:predicted secreted hydrolase